MPPAGVGVGVGVGGRFAATGSLAALECSEARSTAPTIVIFPTDGKPPARAWPLARHGSAQLTRPGRAFGHAQPALTPPLDNL